ncbi:hypothetical protein CEXT_719611 [Caerostris extrusa]|uniref:Uncharacterized protein n=1 Tax=Caerostris extrusa TaxID=172846 RepID=A0AAV4W2C8_CAEEX|nr:hypothetical protein CEXT_719611 [Caerostris extrusa]
MGTVSISSVLGTSNEISNLTPTPTPWSLQRDTSLEKYRLGSLSQNLLWNANETKCAVHTQGQLVSLEQKIAKSVIASE